MTTQEQAYIEGFVKRAAEYGYSDGEAVGLLKSADSVKNFFKKLDAPVNNPGLSPKLNGIFSDQLGKRSYGKNHTFGELRADNLDKVQLLMDFEKHYKKDISDSIIDSHMKNDSTIGSFLKHIKKIK